MATLAVVLAAPAAAALVGVTGNAIASAEGDILVSEVTRVDRKVKVYNFSVENGESYFVSANGLWVHNSSGGGNNVVCNLAGRPVKDKSLTAGTPEHKADRWNVYLESKTANGETPKTYESCEKIYNANVNKANTARAAQLAYADTIKWPDIEHTVEVEVNGYVVKRRLDIADVANEKAIEFKTGKQYASESNLWEVQRDAELIKDGWAIEWVFDSGSTASKPLLKALDEAGITYKFI